MADTVPDAPKLQARGVSMIYPPRRGGGTPTTVLLDFDLDVAANDFVTVLGPSGCGKTTLLNLFAGLEPATAGQLLIDGASIHGPSPERGVIFQQYALFPWLTVQDNVAMGLQLQGRPRRERRDVAQHYIDMVGLKGFEDALPKHLSGGMRQRCAIARAYAARPKVLLMDEPFGALDAMTKTQLQHELLRTWEEERRTVVFITHDIDEAVFLGGRLVVLSDRPGRVVLDERSPLSYPRDPQTRFSAPFQDLRLRLWQALHRDDPAALAADHIAHPQAVALTKEKP